MGDSGRGGYAFRREVDEALDRRLTEIAAAAGIEHSRASLEILYYLPKDFLQRYTELFHASLRLDSGGVGGGSPEEQTAKVSSAYKGKLPGVTGGGKRYKEYWVVLSDDALQLKHRVDKRLRAIGRDILGELGNEGGGDGDDTRTRCSRCGRILARDWNFCAGCGNHRPVGGE